MADSVLLIRPPLVTSRDVIGARPPTLILPVGLAYLAGYLREHGIETAIIDGFGEAPDERTKYDNFDVIGLTNEKIVARIKKNFRIIGISCMFSNDWPYVRNLIFQIKEAFKGSVIVLGGEHATAMPEYVLKECPALDYVVCGEGEKPFHKLVEMIIFGIKPNSLSGVVYRNEKGISEITRESRITALDDLPLPAWDLIPLENYLSRGISIIPRNRKRIMPIITSRGCPYSCKFCSNPIMWGNQYLVRSPEKVIEEIKLYKERYSINGIDIIDLTFITNKKWIINFCELLIKEKLNLEWHVPSTRSEAIDENMVMLLKKSGCKFVYLTPDSGSERQIKEMSKKVDLSRVKVVAKTVLDQGIGVRVNLVFSFPNEKHRDIWETIFYGIKLAWVGVHNIVFLRFTPYPGSEYFELCRKRGQIPPEGPEFDHFLISNVTGELREVRSYTPYVSDRAVRYYLLLGTFLTQTAFILRRPRKGFQVIWRIITNQPDAPLEHAFVAMLRRIKVPIPLITTKGCGECK